MSIGSLPHLFNNPFGDFLSLFVRLAGEPENASSVSTRRNFPAVGSRQRCTVPSCTMTKRTLPVVLQIEAVYPAGLRQGGINLNLGDVVYGNRVLLSLSMVGLQLYRGRHLQFQPCGGVVENAQHRPNQQNADDCNDIDRHSDFTPEVARLTALPLPIRLGTEMRLSSGS